MGHTKQTDEAQGNPLGYAPIPGLIRKFAVPSIISMLVTAAYNMTDQIFIGHVVGMLGNAATNVAFPVTTLVTALAQMVGVGTASNFNISLGAKRQEDAEQFIGTGMTLMSLVGLVIMGLVLAFKTPVLLLCGATDNVLPYAQAYLGTTAFGLPFLLFTYAGSILIRADSSPSYSMFCSVTGAILNVVLDWLFLFVFDWGIRGAAAATVAGQIVSFFLCIRYFPRFRTFKIRRKNFGLRVKYLIEIVKLGTSNFVNLAIMTLVNIVMNNTLTHYGALSVYGSDIPLAVSGIIAKLNSILSAFTVGLAQGCQPILGFNMGAKNYGRVKEIYRNSIRIALSISIAAFLLFQLFPRQIVGIFGTGEELYFQFAERYMRIFMMMVCVYGVQPVCINYFTSIGDMRRGLVLSMSRQGFFLIPMLLAFPLFFGLNGVLYAGPLADALACVLSLTMVWYNQKNMPEA